MFIKIFLKPNSKQKPNSKPCLASQSEAATPIIATVDNTDKIIKPKQGHIYIYPSDKFHSVNEVTAGTRFAIIGWLKSRYLQDHIRESVRDMLDVREYLLDTYGMDDEMYKKANKTLINLMRNFTQ